MGVHRHLYGKADEVQVTVRETVTVKPGDLMFLNNTNSFVTNQLAGASAAADYYAYPWAAGKEWDVPASGVTSCNYGFVGVAMDDSPNGSTDTISIATKGVFRFALGTKGAVTIGAVVQAYRPSGFDASSSTTASRQVQTAITSGGSVGYCIKTESGASNVDFRIRTLLGEGLIS
jgi:hypothetical protein